MAISETELLSFNQFAKSKLDEEDTTLDEVWNMWRIQNPTDEEYAENVAAINASIEDYKNGDRGRPAGETTRELREKYGLPSE